MVLSIDVHNASRGGASEYVTRMAEVLGQRGYEMVIASHRSEAPAGRHFRVISPERPLASFSPYARAVHLQQRVDLEGADVVHDTGGLLLRSDVFHPLMGSRWHNEMRQLRAFPWRRALRHVRHTQIWNLARLQFVQCRNHKALVACSGRVAADFAQLGVATRAVVPNGIELPARPVPERLSELRAELGVGQRLLLLATSNNHYLKGVMRLLEALQLAGPEQRRGWLLVVAGHNQDSEFGRFVQRHGLEEGVRLLDWVSDIDSYYQAADVFVHPTYHDAGSLSTLKALACGKAVITTRWDGSAERMEPGRSGIVLQNNSAAAILEALLRVSQADFRRALGQQAALLGESLSYRPSFARLEQLYGELLGR